MTGFMIIIVIMTCLIVLCIGNPTLSIKTMYRNSYVEDNNEGYNDSKFYGSVCHEFLTNPAIAFPNADTLLTKKGALTFPYHMSTKLPNIVFKYVLVCDKKKGDLKKNSSEEKLYNLCVSKGYNIISSSLCDDFILSNSIKSESGNYLYTCGLNACFNNKKYHCTRGYGITLQEQNELEKTNIIYQNKEYNGIVLNLTINNKPGGKVVYIPELGSTSHLTVNTTIKAMLSGPLIQKFLDNVTTLNLKDIDTTAKVDMPIIIEKEGDTKVLIVDWYQYII